MTMRCVRILLCSLALSGCAMAPDPLQGSFEHVTPAQISGGVGEHVRWGGKIVKVAPQADRTCFTVLSRPLEDSGRPKPGDTSMGRFIACAKGFYDPQVYTEKRQVTVVGNISGTTTRKIGGYPYHYPTVKAAEVYLWPVLAGKQ